MLFLLTMAGTASASEITGSLSSGSGSSTSAAVAPPTASPGPGTYTSPQSVTLTSPGSSSIVYTTDGTAPDCSPTGVTYTGPIAVSTSMTINALSCYSGGISSSVASYAYVIDNGGSLSGSVAPGSGSLTGTVGGGSGSLTGTVAPSSSGSAGSSSGGGSTGVASNGPPVGGGGGSGIIDVCPNLPDTQSTLPAGYELLNGNCDPIGTASGGGSVLGASTGPGIPNTGAGGDAPQTILTLVLSFATFAGGLLLVRTYGYGR